MGRTRILASLAAFFLFLGLTGSAFAVADYNHTAPGRGDDRAIESSIKNSLAEKDQLQARTIGVYSFKGHVFMVGEPVEAFGLWAERVAHYEKDTHFVTAHWFPPRTADANADPALKAAVAARLGPVMRSPNRVEVEVRGRNVLLLGIVRSNDEIVQAEKLARSVAGIKTFRNHLMTSEQSLKAIGTPSKLYQK